MPSAYQLFCNDQRAELKKAEPDLKMGEVAKKLGGLWSEASEATKKVRAHTRSHARFAKPRHDTTRRLRWRYSAFFSRAGHPSHSCVYPLQTPFPTRLPCPAEVRRQAQRGAHQGGPEAQEGRQRAQAAPVRVHVLLVRDDDTHLPSVTPAAPRHKLQAPPAAPFPPFSPF